MAAKNDLKIIGHTNVFFLIPSLMADPFDMISNTPPVFSITLDIELGPRIIFEEKCLNGKISIGSFSEVFNAPIEYWSADDYLIQWREAIQLFLNGIHPICFVTQMRNPSTSTFITTWPTYYTEPHMAVFQNRILFCRNIRKKFTGKNIYDFIRPRKMISDNGEPISEWKIPVSALGVFLKTLA